MANKWNLEELREFIRKNRSDQARLLNIIRSIDRSNTIFNYHIFSARDALETIIGESDSTDIEMMMFALGIHEQQEQKNEADIISEANIISSIYTVRSIYDMFSHLINELVLPKKLEENKCDIKKVFKELPDSKLKLKLGLLLNSYWFKYVDSFINTTKHRNLVNHTFTVSFQENKVGAKIAEFTYRDDIYKSYWAQELLEGVLSVKNNLIICGNSLNNHCLDR